MKTYLTSLCAALLLGPAAAALKPPPPVGSLPDGYYADVSTQQPVATLTFTRTLGQPSQAATEANTGYDAVAVTWSCYVLHADTGTGHGRVPRYRTSAWMVARVGKAANGRIDLHDIGLQHRTMTVMMRASSPHGRPIKLYRVESNGQAVHEEQTVLGAQNQFGGNFEGFYVIRRSGRQVLGNRIEWDNRYQIETEADDLMLECFFADHPPGETAQPEDGGPPPIPPGAQNSN